MKKLIFGGILVVMFANPAMMARIGECQANNFQGEKCEMGAIAFNGHFIH